MWPHSWQHKAGSTRNSTGRYPAAATLPKRKTAAGVAQHGEVTPRPQARSPVPGSQPFGARPFAAAAIVSSAAAEDAGAAGSSVGRQRPCSPTVEQRDAIAAVPVPSYHIALGAGGAGMGSPRNSPMASRAAPSAIQLHSAHTMPMPSSPSMGSRSALGCASAAVAKATNHIGASAAAPPPPVTAQSESGRAAQLQSCSPQRSAVSVLHLPFAAAPAAGEGTSAIDTTSSPAPRRAAAIGATDRSASVASTSSRAQDGSPVPSVTPTTRTVIRQSTLPWNFRNAAATMQPGAALLEASCSADDIPGIFTHLREMIREESRAREEALVNERLRREESQERFDHRWSSLLKSEQAERAQADANLRVQLESSQKDLQRELSAQNVAFSKSLAQVRKCLANEIDGLRMAVTCMQESLRWQKSPSWFRSDGSGTGIATASSTCEKASNGSTPGDSMVDDEQARTGDQADEAVATEQGLPLSVRDKLHELARAEFNEHIDAIVDRLVERHGEEMSSIHMEVQELREAMHRGAHVRNSIDISKELKDMDSIMNSLSSEKAELQARVDRQEQQFLSMAREVEALAIGSQEAAREAAGGLTICSKQIDMVKEDVKELFARNIELSQRVPRDLFKHGAEPSVAKDVNIVHVDIDESKLVIERAPDV